MSSAAPLTLSTRDYHARWEARGESHRRARVRDLLEVYHNCWNAQLEARLRRLFLPENYEKLRDVADTSLNLLRWATDELACIYARPTTRTCDGASDGLEPYDTVTLDLAFDQAARLTYALREILIRPLWNPRREQIELDIITPDRCSVWMDAIDPLAVAGVMIKLPEGRGSGLASYVVWTEESRVYLGPDFQPVRVAEEDDETNPYGVIPYVLCHATYPACGIWHEHDAMALLSATLEAGVQKTDHNHLRHLQSFKQLFFSGLDSEALSRMSSDPATAIYTKNPQGSATVLDLQADLQGHLDSLLSSVGATLNLAGIRPEAVRGTLAAESGYALSIKMHKQAVVWEQQRTIWRVWEQQIYAVARAVAIEDGDTDLPDGSLDVEFGDIGPDRDQLELANAAIALRQAGWSVENVLREVWGKDEEWIAKNAAETKRETAMRQIPAYDRGGPQ